MVDVSMIATGVELVVQVRVDSRHQPRGEFGFG
jgi:hypothetical protein